MSAEREQIAVGQSASTQHESDRFTSEVHAFATRVRESSTAQLVSWPEEFRALPNETARSSLFTVGKGRRRYIEGEALVVLGEGELKYRGQELRTDDEDVWLQALHLARLQPLEEWVEFSPYSFLKALGKPTNGTYYRGSTPFSRTVELRL